MDLTSRKAVHDGMTKYGFVAPDMTVHEFVEDELPPVSAVPLDKLCELLAEMYHCPSSGWPSSGRACHPGCPDEVFEKLCGTDCESYSDVERWRAFLTKWMEGLDVSGRPY